MITVALPAPGDAAAVRAGKLALRALAGHWGRRETRLERPEGRGDEAESKEERRKKERKIEEEEKVGREQTEKKNKKNKRCSGESETYTNKMR